VASDFYDLNLDIEMVETTSDPKLGTHTIIFALRFENTAFVTNLQDQLMREKAVAKMPAVTSALFFSLFPFCVVFNQDMVVVNAGVKLKALVDADDFVGQNFERYLTIRRPKITVAFSEVSHLRPPPVVWQKNDVHVSGFLVR
jgi:hypothetical protein